MEALQLQSLFPRTLSTLSSSPRARTSSSSSSLQLNIFISNHKALSLTSSSSGSSTVAVRAGWFLGLTDSKNKKMGLPETVKAGDPVLHEPAEDVDPNEVRSERIQKIIDDMIRVMRKAPGVGLAAPQIGVPLRIIVLEDTTEYIGYAPKEEVKAQDRRPFDLLVCAYAGEKKKSIEHQINKFFLRQVILNPKLLKKSNKTALFFEGCLSVDGFRALVERHLDVEVTGLDRYGEPIKVTASGWQARILQHECDHLEGTLYVDKMVPKTFRTVENLTLPLAKGCPKLGSR
ncbi:peptide deformylase 1A, chloroplastic/mitochondrial isoform X1 [Arachis hypogaea]|uniref:peptide deformylase 1A, chloroplastic/mitochondrial isoform X1 n=1 Tax=Arachis hypogaea TaxID=3818 RepID=UPI0007AF97A0|nr:peptide deformylase 1A, chloroplastic/mitochondrial isoform X1 [Arachis hypogaea]